MYWKSAMEEQRKFTFIYFRRINFPFVSEFVCLFVFLLSVFSFSLFSCAVTDVCVCGFFVWYIEIIYIKDFNGIFNCSAFTAPQKIFNNQILHPAIHHQIKPSDQPHQQIHRNSRRRHHRRLQYTLGRGSWDID